MASKIKVALAPEKMGGDSIELSHLAGQLVAVFCRARDERKTKFGPRKMTQVLVMTAASKEPLMGIMFQTYFQDLALDTWYIGKVAQVDAGGNKQWILDTTGLDKKMADPLLKALEKVDTNANTGEKLL